MALSKNKQKQSIYVFSQFEKLHVRLCIVFDIFFTNVPFKKMMVIISGEPKCIETDLL